jgi:carbon-monoxide dehydrogenase large subunit
MSGVSLATDSRDRKNGPDRGACRKAGLGKLRARTEGDNGYNTSPRDGTSGAVVSAAGKIRDKAQQLAGMALEARADSLDWADGAFRAGADGGAIKTIADLALYAHGTGALPPGVEGGLDAQTVYRD